MKRRNFLQASLPLAAAGLLPSALSAAGLPMGEGANLLPPYLQPGDLIGITAPAGYISLEEIEPAVKKMEEWGYKLKIGKTIGRRDFTYGGTDEERRDDLQNMLDDKNIKAIMCARGGYGAVRIIDQLNFSLLKKYPKWIIGFSDITVLLSALDVKVKMAGIHSKMCNSFPADWSKADDVQRISIESIRQCLAGEGMLYNAAPNASNRYGKASGHLVGGNLKTLESLAGSSTDLCTKHKILFVEDTGEYLYSIDRMFWNLLRSGKLEKLAGLIVGGFKIKKDDEGEAFGKALEEIVMEKVSRFKYPVCFDFPVGHQKYNVALKTGVPHELEVSAAGSILRSQF